MHEQKFKDLLSSICPVSLERIVLDLESEVHFYWIFLFSHSKACDANVSIIANFVYHGKTRLYGLYSEKEQHRSTGLNGHVLRGSSGAWVYMSLGQVPYGGQL